MADMQDLFTALQMFKQGVGELQTSRVISQANEAVNQVRASEANEQAKRAQLQQISNQLVGQMTALGNPVSAIQNVAAAFGPKQFASADQAMLDAALTGNNAQMALAKQADIASNANKMDMFQAQVKAQEASQKRLFDHQTQLEMMKESHRSQLAQKAGQGDLEFGANFQVAMQEANKLQKLIEQHGNFEVMNPKASAQLKSAAYQLAINYAKIVDPASVAREGEVKAAEQYLVPLGLGTRNSVSMAALDEYKAKLMSYAKARLAQKQMGGAGYAGMTGTGERSPAAPASGNPYFKPYK